MIYSTYRKEEACIGSGSYYCEDRRGRIDLGYAGEGTRLNYRYCGWGVWCEDGGWEEEVEEDTHMKWEMAVEVQEEHIRSSAVQRGIWSDGCG